MAFRLRPGNAGSNTAVDHIEVLDEAIAQIPARYRRNLLITCDGAGATLDLVRHITTLNTAPGRRVHYSVGFDLDARGPHRDRPAVRHRLGPGARPPRRAPRPRRRRRGRADRAAAPLRRRGPAGQLAGGHADHLPPRTALVRGATVADGRGRRLALPAGGDQHPDRAQPSSSRPATDRHARVEDRIRDRQEHRHRPFAVEVVSRSTRPGAWPRPSPRDLLCWLRLLCLDGPLAEAEPKTLRYRLLHTAARLVRGQRKRKIKIPETWPWAGELEACFLAIFALPAPT